MSRTLRILLVEDHPEMSELLQLFLDRLGHVVTAVAGVTEALLTAQRKEFDLLISDYRLADGTGVDLMRRLCESCSMSGICLTGYGDEVAAVCHAAGFDAVLAKPVNMETLERAIGELPIAAEH